MGEFVVPLAIKVPAFPSETPVRISQSAPVNRWAGNHQIIGEDGCHIPPQGGGHVEIVINSGLGNNGVSLVSEPVDVVIVAVIPKAAGRRLGNGGRV